MSFAKIFASRTDSELIERHRNCIRDGNDCVARYVWREIVRRRCPKAIRHLGCRYSVTKFYLFVYGERGNLKVETRAGEAAEREVIRRMRKKKGL